MSHQVKKMKQGMSYSCKEKTIILNVFKYFRQELPEKCVTDIVRRTALATGCSSKSIFQFRKEEASVEGFKEPSKRKIRKNLNMNSRDIKYDNTVRQGIKNVIYDLRYKNIVTSLKTILEHVNGDPLLPNFSLMTLRRLLFDMGFYYEKNGNKSTLVEKMIPITPDGTTDKKPVKTTKKRRSPSKEKINIVDVPESAEQPKSFQKFETQQQSAATGNQYNVPNHFLVPMHLRHNNKHGYMITPLSSHNRPVVINSRIPPPHVIQAPWMHMPQHSQSTMTNL